MAITYQQRSFDRIAGDHQLTPLLERLFSARGVSSTDQLDYDLKQLTPPQNIYQLLPAAEFIVTHINDQSRFLIIGDYDADGATSTTLLIKGLRAFGVKQIDFVLPDRITEGYGVTLGLVERVLQFKPDIVITVDTGTSSIEGIDCLKQAGVAVVVTDHHLPAAQLPAADVIVNPNAYPKSISPKGRCLAGVGVAFYLLLALRQVLRQQSYFKQNRQEPNLALYLDIVALGTVADLVPMDYLNRILVAQGLKLMQQHRGCDGIKQLFTVSNKAVNQASHQDLGFAIGPRINAAGRLDDMSLGVQCLLSNANDATFFAQQLNDINGQRRALQADIQIDTDQLLSEFNEHYPEAIVLSHKDWHEGVVGIVASQLKAKTYRPVFVFAQTEGGLLKGSGRSISGVHLRDVLDYVDKKTPNVIIKFGGHAMAAGLSIKSEHLEDFRNGLLAALREMYSSDIFSENKWTDGELEADELTLETADSIAQAGPWGQLFDEPEFIGQFKVIEQRVLKEAHIKLILEPIEQSLDQPVEAIAFFCEEALLSAQFDTIDICYRLSVNEFRGQRSLQLMISNFISFNVI